MLQGCIGSVHLSESSTIAAFQGEKGESQLDKKGNVFNTFNMHDRYLFLFLSIITLKDHNNGVFTGIFTRQCVACEDAGRAAYSQLRSHITGEYNRQQAGISSQTTEYVARHPVYTQRVHSYSRTRSQNLEILSV